MGTRTNIDRRVHAMATIGVAMGLAMAWQGIAHAQARAAFEVSPAIRLAARGPRNTRTQLSRTPKRIAFQAALVGDIMAFAYDLPLDRVERRPQWMYDFAYDVAVSTAAPASVPEQKLMLQKLLEERFGLAVHRISYASPVFFLVPGPKTNLTPTQEADMVDLPKFGRQPGYPPARNAVVANHVSMSDLAAWLYPQLGLPVVDKTGITGLFDLEIRGMPLRGGAEGIIRAVQDSLGLILERHQGTAESLIIDRSEKPKEN